MGPPMEMLRLVRLPLSDPAANSPLLRLSREPLREPSPDSLGGESRDWLSERARVERGDAGTSSFRSFPTPFTG
jgi:hypothetical protein